MMMIARQSRAAVARVIRVPMNRCIVAGSSTGRSYSSQETKPIVTGTLPAGGQGVAVSQYAEVKRIFTVEQVAQFGKLIGDENPLHSPQASFPPSFRSLETAGIIQWQENDNDSTSNNINRQSKVLVHGMMVGSLFSCIFGSLIPGSVYRSQRLSFQSPVFCNEEVTGRVLVTKVRPWREGLVLTCDTTVVCKEGQTCITGEASVWLPTGKMAKQE